jgi:hypothetical protein
MPLGQIFYCKHVQTDETLKQDETKTRSINKEEDKKCADVKRFQSKAPPCCPHLFIRHDTSYDADISSNLELSPQTERLSNKSDLFVLPTKNEKSKM